MQTNVQIDSKNLGSEQHGRGTYTLEELVASSPSERNWRGIFIALLVIAAVLGLIGFSIFLLSPDIEGPRVKGRRLQLQDIVGDRLRWRRFNGTWLQGAVAGEELVYRDAAGGLSVFDAEAQETRVLMTNSAFRQLNADSFAVSPDQNFVLLMSDNGTDGRARYSIFELSNRNIFPLSQLDRTLRPPLLQRVLWAPTVAAAAGAGGGAAISRSRRAMMPTGGGTFATMATAPAAPVRTPAQGIAFVHDNDVYYKPRVEHDLVCRLTTSGVDGVVYNGRRDWLYENTPELRSEPMVFSEDGGFLAYMEFNDTAVDKYDYAWLGIAWKYPEIRSVRYPKEGSRIPNVTIYVVDLTALKRIQRIPIRPPPSSSAIYVGQMHWTADGDLTVTFMNRNQSAAVNVQCRPPAFVCRRLHMEHSVADSLVLVNDPILHGRLEAIDPEQEHSREASNHIHPNGLLANEFDARAPFLFKRLPVQADDDLGHFRHVVFISGSDQRAIPLTSGPFEVTELLAWDAERFALYFMASPPKRAGERHLYRIRVRFNRTISGGHRPSRMLVTASRPACMTCNNSPDTFRLLRTNVSADAELPTADKKGMPPNNCQYNRVRLSPGFGHYVQECLGPESPATYLVAVETLHKLVVLNDGAQLRRRLKTLALPQIYTLDVEIRDGFHAQVRLLLPPGLREDEEVVFPMVLHIDASPGSQLATKRFEVDWNWYLCSQRSTIVAQIDARGSGGQGERLQAQTKGRLGTVEIEDQLAVLTYLRDRLHFIDATRICAYGWGYGGYAAAMVLAEDSQAVLQCAVAVNPIVSFAHHSTFFADRFMPSTSSPNDPQPADHHLTAAATGPISGQSVATSHPLPDADLTLRAGNLADRQFYLVHGTADTLVHEQHSLMLARALIAQGVNFRHQVYTDEDHQLSGVRLHLYKSMEWFVDESFGTAETSEWDPTGFFAPFRH